MCLGVTVRPRCFSECVSCSCVSCRRGDLGGPAARAEWLFVWWRDTATPLPHWHRLVGLGVDFCHFKSNNSLWWSESVHEQQSARCETICSEIRVNRCSQMKPKYRSQRSKYICLKCLQCDKTLLVVCCSWTQILKMKIIIHQSGGFSGLCVDSVSLTFYLIKGRPDWGEVFKAVVNLTWSPSGFVFLSLLPLCGFPEELTRLSLVIIVFSHRTLKSVTYGAQQDVLLR